MLRVIRNLLILVVIVAVMQALVRHYGEAKRDRAIAQGVENANAQMPIVVGGRLRVEKAEYSNHTVRYSAVFLGDDTIGQREKDNFEQGIGQLYCHGNMKLFSDANVGIEYSIKTQSDTVTFSVTPDRCH